MSILLFFKNYIHVFNCLRFVKEKLLAHITFYMSLSLLRELL